MADTVESSQDSFKPAEGSKMEDDPGEDDLDELDDMLDEFAGDDREPEKSTEPRATKTDGVSEDGRDMAEKLAKMLPQGGEGEDMSKLLEQMMLELTQEAEDSEPEQSSQGVKPQPPKPSESISEEDATLDKFQTVIQQTMRRMQDSGQQADKANNATGSSQDEEGGEEQMLLNMLKGAMGGSLDGAAGSEDELTKMLSSVVEQMTTKEMVYPPMKELNDKYGSWLKENKDNKEVISTEKERQQYEEQARVVSEIVSKLESPDYSDDNEGDKEAVLALMEKMQEQGQPPAQLLSGWNDAQSSQFGKDLEEGCPQQ